MDTGGRNEQSEPIFIRISEVARLLSMSRASAYEAIQKGVIPARKIDGKWRVPLAALEQMAAEAIAAKADASPGVSISKQ